MTITTAQIRAARGLLNWSQSELALRTGISATSIGAIENGNSTPREHTLQLIKKMFEKAGIEFLSDQGVRVRQSSIYTFSGRHGFIEFFDDIYDTVREEGGDILISNVQQLPFTDWLGEEKQNQHRQRMKELNNFKMKVLVQEGDYDFAVSFYAEYRWTPKEQFDTVPFYIYGKKLAIILFSPQPKVFLLEHPQISDAYKKQFYFMWDQALIPDIERCHEKI